MLNLAADKLELKLSEEGKEIIKIAPPVYNHSGNNLETVPLLSPSTELPSF